MGRDDAGDWSAAWGNLAYSDADGRVDWVCGEATQKNLENAVLSEVNKAGKREAEKLNDRISKARESALAVIKG